MYKGLIIVNTGTGKGKTTAAFGMILRAVGHAMKSCIIQFIKQKQSGEITALKKLAPDLVSITMHGRGFTWESDDLSKDKAAACEGWEKAKLIIKSNECSTLLLDEITYPINYGMIALDDVVSTLENKPNDMNIIITGRDAPEEICQIADCVSVISAEKHHFKNGVAAQKGIEI